MPVIFTLSSGALVDQPFAALGLTRLRRTLLNQGNDRVTFEDDGSAVDGAAQLAYGATVTIKRDLEKWFVGRVVRVSRAGAAGHEGHAYELAGPWWYLQNLVYQQNWKIPTTPTNPASALTDEKRSSLILNLKEDGTTLTTRQQIKDVVDYAIAAGAPIAVTDTDFPALNVSWEEGKDMLCAEVIRRQLRWAPDACLWWDYAAATPTLKCARRAGATAVNFAVVPAAPSHKAPVRAASDDNEDIAAAAFVSYGGSGALAAGDRLLLMGQSDPAENGIYIFDSFGNPLLRASDADSAAELNNAVVTVDEGTHAGAMWVQTETVATIDTDDVAWAQAVAGLAIVERPDLQVPVVSLKFERVDQQDDISWTQTAEDKYPAVSDAQFGALVMTIPLAGGVVNYQRQKVKTRAIAETSDTWWKKHIAYLNDATVTGVTIASGAKTDLESSGISLTNELVAGAVPSWLDAYATQARATALLSYTITDATTGAITVVKDKPVAVNFIATTSRIQSSSETAFKEYKQLVSWVAGETAPTGLAQSLYDALSVLQYEGSVTLEQRDVPSVVHPGHVLHIKQGLAAWATMGAQIQSVDEDVDMGTTRIVIGPAQQLGPQDLLELLRPNRSRHRALTQPTRTTGQARADAVTDGSTRAANHAPSSSSGLFSKLVLVDPAGTTKIVQLDATTLAAGETATWRTVKVWDDVTSSCKTMKVLGTLPV